MVKRIRLVNVLLIITVLLMIVLLQSCANTDSTEDMDDYTWYEITDNILNINLDANATTGYMWTYNMSCQGILVEDYSSYVVNEHKEGMVGVGGIQKYSFIPVADGITSIKFKYLRTIEQDSVIDTRVITIKVENGKMFSP